MSTLSGWDYGVVIVMMAVSAGIGIYYRFTGGKQKTTRVSELNFGWLLAITLYFHPRTGIPDGR